ncbi:MAG: YadA-like family protein [Hyphomicrobiales bacterium]
MSESRIAAVTHSGNQQYLHLRGGRITKYKGIVASYAPHMAALMLGVSAIALGTAETARAQTWIAVGPAGAPATVCNDPASLNFTTVMGPHAGNYGTFCNGAGFANHSSYFGHRAGGAAIGYDQTGVGTWALAQSVGAHAVGLGHWAGGQSYGESTSFFGHAAGFQAWGDRMVAMGHNALRDAKGTGTNTHPNGTVGSNGASDAVGIGTEALMGSFGKQNTGIGLNAGKSITGDDNVAIGVNANSTGVTADKTTAIGGSTKASANNATAIAYGAEATNVDAVAIVVGSKAAGVKSSALGPENSASGTKASAVGYKNTADGVNSVAVGANNNVNGAEDGVAMGVSNSTDAKGLAGGVAAMGVRNKAHNANSTAVGINNEVKGLQDSAFGFENKTDGLGAAVAVGWKNEATANGAAAFGQLNKATGVGAFAIGQSNTAAHADSVVIGHNAATTAANQIMLGKDGQAVNVPDAAANKITSNKIAVIDANGNLKHSELDGTTITNVAGTIGVHIPTVGSALAGKGLTFNNGTEELDVNPGDGLALSGDEVVAVAGSGITVDSGGIHVDIASVASNITPTIASNLDGTGLTLNSATGKLDVNPGDGIEIVNDKVQAKLEPGGVEFGTNGGLQINAQDTVNRITGDNIAITSLTGGVVNNIAGDLNNRNTLSNALVRKGLSVDSASGKIDVNVDGTTVKIDDTTNELYVDTTTIVPDLGSQLAGDGLTFNSTTNKLDVATAEPMIIDSNGKVNLSYDTKTLQLNANNELTVIGGGGITAGNAGEGLVFNKQTNALDVNAGNGMEIVNNKVQALAGDNSIVVDQDGVKANVDNKTIEVGSNGLQVKAGGIDTEHIRDGAVTGDKIADGSIEERHLSDGLLDKIASMNMKYIKKNAKDISKNREGIALAMALQAPYVERDRRVAITGGLGYYEGKTSMAGAAALRLTSHWQVSAGLAVGFKHGTFGGRIGTQLSW